ncbi:MAG: hypothetical protein ACI80V_003598, partial [Rhodothermales bacterium]
CHQRHSHGPFSPVASVMTTPLAVTSSACNFSDSRVIVSMGI